MGEAIPATGSQPNGSAIGPRSANRPGRKKRRVRFKVTTGKNPGGSIYYKVSGTHNGRQQRKRFPTPEAAEKFRGELELKADCGSAINLLHTRMNQRQLQRAEAATELISAKFPHEEYDLLTAVQYFADNFVVPKTEHTFSSVESIYLDEKKDKVGVRQFNNIRGMMRRAAKAFPKEQLHCITKEMLNKFFSATFGERSEKTWNNFRTDLSAFFNWCKAEPREWMRKNPVDGVEIHDVDSKLPTIVNPTQAREIMADVEKIENGTIALLFALFLFGGIRTDQEIRRLAKMVSGTIDPEQLIITDEMIMIGKKISKTKERRFIPVRENLKAWIRRYPFTAANFNMKAFDKHYPEIRKRHKIPHNAMRHSYDSYLTKVTSQDTAAAAAGHSKKVQEEYYLNLLITSADATAYWEIVPLAPAVTNHGG